MSFKVFIESKRFKQILKVIGVAVVVLTVFQLGVFVGFRKARFSYRLGDNYHRMFGGPRGGLFSNFAGRDFFSGHGTVGSIVRIDGQSLVIKGRDSVEKIVGVDSTTTIRKARFEVSLADLKPGDEVVIVGTPKDDGSIEAKVIRLFNFAGPPTSTGPRF